MNKKQLSEYMRKLGRKGAKKTNSLYGHRQKEWGARGGRPKGGKRK